MIMLSAAECFQKKKIYGIPSVLYNLMLRKMYKKEPAPQGFMPYGAGKRDALIERKHYRISSGRRTPPHHRRFTGIQIALS